MRIFQLSQTVPPGSFTSDLNGPDADVSDKSQSQRLAASHQAGIRCPESAATSAELTQKSLVSSQIPLPDGGSTNGERKTNSTHESALTDGSALGHKKC